MIDESKFSTKEEIFDFLVKNKQALIMQKKAAIKQADAVSYMSPLIDKNDAEIKADIIDTNKLLNQDSIKVKVVINTTNLMDSHSDVHMKGIWKKSVKEQAKFLHLQEHNMAFDKVISSNAKGSVETIKWTDLGYDYKGETEALVFKTEIEKARNKFMFEQYAKGYVENHSVGMQYVQLFLAVNDERYAEEKATWDKYINEVANAKQAEQRGYFWAVTEAKIIEGSAVVKGSNYATPTISVKEISEPEQSTQKHIEDSRQSDTIRQALKESLKQIN